jgi:hypothetical protein
MRKDVKELVDQAVDQGTPSDRNWRKAAVRELKKGGFVD